MGRLTDEIKRRSDEFCRNKCGSPDPECEGCYGFSVWYQSKFGKYLALYEEDEE